MSGSGRRNGSDYESAFNTQHEAWEDATLAMRIYGDDSDEYKLARIEAEEVSIEFRKNYHP